MKTKPGSDLLYLQIKISELDGTTRKFVDLYKDFVNSTIDESFSRNYVELINFCSDDLTDLMNEISGLIANLGRYEIVEEESQRSYFDGDRTKSLTSIMYAIQSLQTSTIGLMKDRLDNLQSLMHDFNYISS